MQNNRRYKCHLKKPEKDYHCLGCMKKYVCNKPTSKGFYLMFGKSFEEHLKDKDKPVKKLFDYDWLNEKQ